MKYIYLPFAAFVKTWVNGGEIPLKLASTYRSHESDRNGKMTPDECKTLLGEGLTTEIYDDFRSKVAENVRLHGGSLVTSVGTATNFHQDNWDGLVLCLSNACSEHICRKLGYAACIVVEDVDSLYQQISRQLGVEGERHDCSYTTGYNRHIFLKSDKDAWQQEYRMFWPVIDEQVKVSIAPGTARLLWLLEDLPSCTEPLVLEISASDPFYKVVRP
jgi:hypothetical protein